MLPMESHFNAIDAFLLQWQWLWREVPFKQPSLSWFERHPQWKIVAEAIDDTQLSQLATDADALYAFARQQLRLDIEPDYYRIKRMDSYRVNCIADTTTPLPPEGISTRKWQQICAFGDAFQHLGTSNSRSSASIIEWCAGKGHLSRALLQQQLCNSAVGLEWDTALIDLGTAAARRDNVALHLQQQNVLDDSVEHYCTAESHHIALHACGKLHISMLRHCSAKNVKAIDLVPCCYHLVDDMQYQPLSGRARQSTLSIDKEALKLALQETVTAPATARRNRQRLQRWRLGFDALQRTIRGIDDYLPVPSMPNAAHADFREFCTYCAALKQLELPADLDHAYFEALGHQRFEEVSRFDLIRQLFRRPIELWLALDRCLFLQERGYEVDLAEFCSRTLTPRNLWIHARYRESNG